jgi:uncharacterized Zn-finger protein
VKNLHEPVIVLEKEVMCDGPVNAAGVSTLGHPRIYLYIQTDNRIDCPYCGRVFIYDAMASTK